MTDLTAFSEDRFDPKAWINASCAAKGQDEPLERFLAELEMRLQLGAEEIEASLIECSSAALRRVPFAQQEVSRLRGDVSALQVSAKTLVTSVTADAEEAAAAAAPLAALHTARSNMQAGCATLREAAELSGAFRRVEEVFAAGDLPSVAEMLRSMAKSLALVGDVPEFREGRGKLAALEDRLQRRVEGRLAEALQANSSQDVASLAALLLAVGRYNSLEAAYVNSRTPIITAIWEEASAMLNGTSTAAPAAAGAAATSGLGGGWLLLLYNNLLNTLESDSAWLASCLPAQRQQLLLAVATAAFEKLNKQITARLAGLHSTKVLAGLLGDVVVAARRLREVLAAAAAGGVEDSKTTTKLLKLLLDPLEQQVSRYSALEEPVLAAELSAQLPVTPSPVKQPPAAAAAADSEDLDTDIAPKLSAACSKAFLCVSSVVERCMLLTGGTELPQLLKNLDKQVAGYLHRMQAAVGIVNGRYTRLAAAASPSADISIMLQLVTLARHVSSKVNSLETLLRSTIAQSLPRLQQSASTGLPPLGLTPTAPAAVGGQGQHGIPAAAAAAAAELLPLRLAAFHGKLGPVGKLLESSGSSRFMSLPSSHAAGNALCESISSAVYDALLAPVLASLAPLPNLPDWTATAAGAAGGVVPGVGAVVPSFSAYPLPAVTAVGEYLMGLPQQLEVLISDEQQEQEPAAAAAEQDEGDELAAEWLDKVVRGAGLMYGDTLLHIKQLSPSGAAQMAADAEYFCNVMSALAVPPPTALITAQLFAAAPADAFEPMADGAVAAGSADVKVLRAIAVMRGITWTGASASSGGAAVAAAEVQPDNAQQLL